MSSNEDGDIVGVLKSDGVSDLYWGRSPRPMSSNEDDEKVGVLKTVMSSCLENRMKQQTRTI
jgi:hypothetical protein